MAPQTPDRAAHLPKANPQTFIVPKLTQCWRARTAAVAVVGRAEDGHDILVMAPVEALHHQLVRPRLQGPRLCCKPWRPLGCFWEQAVSGCMHSKRTVVPGPLPSHVRH